MPAKGGERTAADISGRAKTKACQRAEAYGIPNQSGTGYVWAMLTILRIGGLRVTIYPKTVFL
jgi:hypothetical protein